MRMQMPPRKPPRERQQVSRKNIKPSVHELETLEQAEAMGKPVIWSTDQVLDQKTQALIVDAIAAARAYQIKQTIDDIVAKMELRLCFDGFKCTDDRCRTVMGFIDIVKAEAK